jgi:carbonic anhydrase
MKCIINWILKTGLLMSSLLATMACSSGPTPIPSNSISTQELSNSATPPFQTQNHNSIYKEPILHPESHWSYEGITGPKTWASLKEEYAQCGRGQRQSPINLVWSRPKKQGPITFNYSATSASIEDNGHTIVTHIPSGQTVSIRGQDYELLQLHFHAPSEHTFSGRAFPMEIHFVHKNPSGGLGVIAVLVEEGAVMHPSIEEIWNHLPTSKHSKVEIEKNSINPEYFLPAAHTYYHYNGSLTTPPCSESVNWNVMNTPIQLSRDQIQKFLARYNHNNRPLQPINGRNVTNY